MTSAADGGEKASRITERIERLLADRDAFDRFVYTPIDEAIDELQRRQDNTELEDYIARLLPHGIPEVMRGKKSVVLFRHIATPNYEIRRFIMLSNLIGNQREEKSVIEPLILEYLADKFTNRNEWKYSLGRLYLHKGNNKKQEAIFDSIYVIDFNSNNSKPISSIKTFWGESLVDFHHHAFFDAFPSLKENIADLSSWLQKSGGDARSYYKSFFALFLKHGILLENFLLAGKELNFTREVILPALLEIEEETGLKPLIVALEPTTLENERFWLSHPHEHMKGFVDGRSGSAKE